MDGISVFLTLADIKENQETLGSLKIEVSAALQKCPTKEPKGKGQSQSQAPSSNHRAPGSQVRTPEGSIR